MKASRTHPVGSFPIVGIGASAGGLEAFTQFLKGLPPQPGMALVLIQHLDPKHESMTTEILSRSTRMPVAEVKDGMRVESNHVYVIPPNHSMSISNGVLSLQPRVETRAPYMTIDFFFESLAEDQKSKAIGVVLSGTATDGTEGIRAIKAAGGITLAQDPKTAKFDGMPRSAIESRSIDFILSPGEIGQELSRIATHPYITLPEKESAETGDTLTRLFKLLKQQTRVDFSEYKHSTVQRRISRRMVVQKKQTLEDYFQYLQSHPEEVEALYADILIHVTGFFRDPDAFKALGNALPKLMKNRPRGAPLRVWVPGCSTGEEVYSLAITLMEFLGDLPEHTPLQIFATDISEQALQKARAGIYPESATRSITQGRLKAFFVKVEGGYKISKQIRDLCVFSRHDVTADPPFAKLDLISCRNLLIYFSTALQKRLIPIFQYALKPEGLLWLGRAESISEFSALFEPLDKINKIYARKPSRTDARFQYPLGPFASKEKETSRTNSRPATNGFDLQSEADRAILSESAPPGVVINDRMEILQFRGRTAPYLESAPGQASHNLLKMARPTLVSDLRVLIQSAKKKKTTVTKEGVDVTDEIGRVWTFNLKVIPIQSPAPLEERYFLILFEHATILEKSSHKKSKTKSTSILEKRNAMLEHELAEAAKYQESLTQDYETAHEELAATNEEFQSTNEELQTANEELETAKEELQSTNEELTTLNDELQSRNTELNQLNNDLTNFLSSVEIPILMVGNDQRIRRFTPKAGKALNLIASDIGRPLSDIKSNFSSIGLEIDLSQLIIDVTETMQPKETEVQDREGHWYRLQVKPYRTLDNQIHGAVVAFIDIDILKQSLKEVTAARAESESANRAKDLFLATLSHELRTPLTAILSWAQMLRRGQLDPEGAKRAAEMIEENSKAQAQLINDLLDVSRIVMGKLALDLKEVDPSIAVHAAVESVRPLAESKSIRIETELEPEPGTVMADLARLQQVFSNLLTNSVKFSAPESKIHIHLERSAGTKGEKARIRVQVIDSGKGIAPEFLPHIFDRFTQADSSKTRVYGGLGLGLAIVRNLLELQGGTIEAESAGVGKGATFTIFLPLKSERKTTGAQNRENANEIRQVKMGQTRLDGLRVLLVDDEPNAREAFTEMLGTYGAEVKAVESAREALGALHEFKPDVLLSDIAMPDEDGYSLIRKIRALPPEECGRVPAIAVTAHAAAEDILRALSAGFQAHVAKPLDSDYLANVVATVAKAPVRVKKDTSKDLD